MNCEKAVYSIRAALKVKRAMVPSNVVVISLASFSKILPLYHSTLHFRSGFFKLINNSKDLFSITFTSVSSAISFVLIVILDDLLTTSSPLYHVTFGSGLALQRHFMLCLATALQFWGSIKLEWEVLVEFIHFQMRKSMLKF
uniref:Uncharacterized protein n=1 Tax=Glossina palpalis gambiensis TaxID=67801 RepID=A0A1B0BWS6_9MUSC